MASMEDTIPLMESYMMKLAENDPLANPLDQQPDSALSTAGQENKGTKGSDNPLNKDKNNSSNETENLYTQWASRYAPAAIGAAGGAALGGMTGGWGGALGLGALAGGLGLAYSMLPGDNMQQRFESAGAILNGLQNGGIPGGYMQYAARSPQAAQNLMNSIVPGINIPPNEAMAAVRNLSSGNTDAFTAAILQYGQPQITKSMGNGKFADSQTAKALTTYYKPQITDYVKSQAGNFINDAVRAGGAKVNNVFLAAKQWGAQAGSLLNGVNKYKTVGQPGQLPN